MTNSLSFVLRILKMEFINLFKENSLQEQRDKQLSFALKRSRFFEKEIRPYVIGDSCCNKAILMAESELREVVNPTQVVKPENCDLLIVHGVITPKLVPYIKETVNKLSYPYVVMAIGQCTISGTFFKTIPLNEIVNVDINVVGCAPEPEEIKAAVSKARDLLKEKMNQPREVEVAD